MIGKCTVCGAYSDLRPYGKGGALICFSCGTKDEEETKRQFSARLGDGPLVVVGDNIVELSMLCLDELIGADKKLANELKRRAL